ncbi:unnamed protein product [Prunus armeniaca]
MDQEICVKLRRGNSKQFTVGLKKYDKMKTLDHIYIDEIVTDFEKGWEFAKFNIVRSDKAHKKPNGWDYGIFVLNWVEDIECTSHSSNKFRVVDEELNNLAQHGPFIPHHPITKKPMTRSQTK